jgi:hypothetical protein
MELLTWFQQAEFCRQLFSRTHFYSLHLALPCCVATGNAESVKMYCLKIKESEMTVSSLISDLLMSSNSFLEKKAAIQSSVEETFRYP